MSAIEIYATKLERKAAALRTIAGALQDLTPEEQREVLDDAAEQITETQPAPTKTPKAIHSTKVKSVGPLGINGARADQAAAIVERHGTATLEVVAQEMESSKSLACHALRAAVASGRVEKDPQIAGVYRAKAA